MGLIHGFSGAGKSTATTELIRSVDGVYVRAMSLWSPSALCAAVAAEIGLEPLHGSSKLLLATVDRLNLTKRPLFVDEADYLFHSPRAVETLRDIHDVTSVPVVLVGMDGIERKILRSKQLSRRMARRVEFLPLDREDLDKFVDRRCEIALAPCLKLDLFEQTQGSIGLATVALPQYEDFWRGEDRPLSLADWRGANKQLFLGACQ
jgi:DNA transposition AAA+ family ATPase